MGLRSPYGNGPSNLAQPTPQPNIPPPPAQGPRAPAMAATAPSPSPTPQAGLSPDEAALIQKAGSMSSDDQALLAKAGSSGGDDLIIGNGDDPVHQFMRDKFGAIRQNKDGTKDIKMGGKWEKMSESSYSALSTIASVAAHTYEVGASTAGMVAGGMMAGSKGAVAGGALGADWGNSVVELAKHALGTKDAGDRDTLLSHVANMAQGAMAAVAPEAVSSGLESAAGQMGGRLAAAQTASEAAQPALQAAGQAGTDLMAHQSAPGTVMGSEQMAQAQKIGSGGFGAAPQNELLAKQAQQEAQVGQAWNDIKDSYAPKRQMVTQGGVSSEEVFKPHEALSDLLDSKRQAIGGYKKAVLAQVGDQRVDATSLKADSDASLGPLLDSKGRINTDVVNLDTESGKNLVKHALILRNSISRSSGAFAEVNGVNPRPVPGGMFEGMKDTGPAEYMGGGQEGTLGPVSSGDINMTQTRPAMTSMAENPNASHLPPNEAGDAKAGISIRELDKYVDSLQDYTGEAMNRGDANAKKFALLAKNANKVLIDSYDKAVADRKAAPEFYGSSDDFANNVDMLKRHNVQYSKMVDNFTTLTDGVSSNPMIAVRQIMNNKNPEEVRELFHTIPQEMGDSLRRGFMDSVEGSAASNGPSRLFRASAVKAELAKYPSDMLDTIFAGKTQQVKAVLDTAANLEKARIDPNVGPPKAMADGIAMSIAKLPVKWADKAISFFRGNQPLEKYLSTPDFMDQIVKYQKLSNFASKASTAATPIRVGGTAALNYGGQKLRGQ